MASTIGWSKGAGPNECEILACQSHREPYMPALQVARSRPGVNDTRGHR